jgi:hypothetical protein
MIPPWDSILLGSVKFNTGDPPPVPLKKGDLYSPLLDPPPVPLKKGEARGCFAFISWGARGDRSYPSSIALGL